MEKINFSDNIQASGRNLYLQTNTMEPGRKIVSTLFDGGRLMAKETTSYDEAVSSDRLFDKVKEFHENHKESLEFIYQISTRVKTVRHPRSLLKLAGQFLKWNLIDEAISELEYALEYDKNIADVYVLLAEAYLKRGAPDEAVKIMEQAVHIFPQYPDLWKNLAHKQIMTGELSTAEVNIDRAIEINSEYIEAHLYKSYLLVQKGISQFQQSPDKEILEAIRFHLNRVLLSEKYGSATLDNALRSFHNGNFDDLNVHLDVLIKGLQPQIDLDFHDLFYLQYLFGEQGKNPEYVDSYVNRVESLVRKNPKYPDLHNMLGIGYLIQCRILFNKALHQFKVACKLNPLYERAKNNLKLAENDGKGFLILLRAMLK